MDGIGKYVKGISVVERLGSQELVKILASTHRFTVVYMGVRLNDPQELLAWVVEVELNLVRRRSDRFITSKLELLDQILMRVLGHAAALISVKEYVIDVKRSSNNRLVEGSIGLNVTVSSGLIHLGNSPQALINSTEVKINLYLVVLESNEGYSKAGIAAEPKLKGYVKSGFRESLARSTNLGGASVRVARSINVIEVGISNVGKLSSVTNHLVVTTSLF
jgi:hypothetical protein